MRVLPWVGSTARPPQKNLFDFKSISVAYYVLGRDCSNRDDTIAPRDSWTVVDHPLGA